MEYSDIIIYCIEILGTVAFASSGAMLAMQRGMDLFGVNVLGLTTAMGGGLIRDLILGMNPPAMFQDSSYALTSILTSSILFFCMYFRKQLFTGSLLRLYDGIMMLCDTLGLGIFTVVGVHTAINCGYSYNRFLLVFVGVLTGVGGGMLRDIMANMMPYIFVKHIYAVASLCGALVCVFVYPYGSPLLSMLLGSLTVIIIRFLAAKFLWNLPRVEL